MKNKPITEARANADTALTCNPHATKKTIRKINIVKKTVAADPDILKGVIISRMSIIPKCELGCHEWALTGESFNNCNVDVFKLCYNFQGKGCSNMECINWCNLCCLSNRHEGFHVIEKECKKIYFFSSQSMQ